MNILLVLAFVTCAESAGVSELGMPISFQDNNSNLSILVDGEHFASYVYEDNEIPRPYFCRVTAPGGIQVTRTHPTDPNTDKSNDDHATFHPGIWLAFGDLGGVDFWRNKARVRHVRFEQTPICGDRGSFSVVNAYETTESPSQLLCEETCRYTIIAGANERWILAESQFRAMKSGISLGDQEEMGLGVRLATPLTVKHGNGSLTNTSGGMNEEGTWGKQADWCAFSGVIDGRRAGVMLAVAPDNFRKSWFHNRDYGLMVANPFGRKSMTAPKDNTVKPDATPLSEETVLSLGFAVCVFSDDTGKEPDYAMLYNDFLRVRSTFIKP